jgi:hypothetical protein
MALAVNDTIEGGNRARFTDEFILYQIREKLGFNLKEWLQLPEWEIRLNIKRLKIIGKLTAPPPPPEPPKPKK